MTNSCFESIRRLKSPFQINYSIFIFFFFSSRRRHTRLQGDWSSDVCSSDLDEWALRSHQRAAQGTDDGRLTAEIVPWLPARPGEPVVTQDNGIRRDTSLEQMAKLKPVFDRRYGSVTAANSSPLTDGASAVLLTSDAAARALGYTPLAYVRSYAVAAVDPGWQLLQAPIFAVPKALERAGIGWRDLGLVEVHEAFAAQVLSNLQGWRALGWEIDPEIINVMGEIGRASCRERV